MQEQIEFIKHTKSTMKLRKVFNGAVRKIGLAIFISLFCFHLSYAQKGKDKGFFLMGPEIETASKNFKDGKRMFHYTHEGMIVSDNPKSPWHDASMYVQGTALLDKEGKRIADVALCESTDPNGDLCWFVLWTSDKGYEFTLRAGTGKWNNISGKASGGSGELKRADNNLKFPWEMSWEILEGEGLRGPINRQEYTYHDSGLSFHGPHIITLNKELKNGVNLVYSDQSGVLLSDNRDAVSPRNFSTCWDRGTTYYLNGKNLGDVMLLEDTDPDGDMVWLYHEWWYGKGPGTYDFIGGTGKWKGISGRGVTRGMFKERTDDHFMLRSELHWNISE